MAYKRKLKIGFLFNQDSNWMGGIMYLLNTVRILNYLSTEEMPLVFIFYNKNCKKYVEKLNYPFLTKIEWCYPNIYYGYLKSWLNNRNIFIEKIIANYELDAVFPLQDFPVKSNINTKLISWYADLQHMYYPNYFSIRKRFERNSRIKYIFKNCENLVVSSQSVKDDFIKFFSIPEKLNIHIYRFVSVINKMFKDTIDTLREKYSLPQNYFMVCNQFHKHKNHKVILKALAGLKKEKNNIHIVFTGRLPDNPKSSYLKELHDIIKENNILEKISFLGLIPRDDQLLLMKYSQAIIQPSIFEGWSTVIEDAKSLQVPVVASNIEVNIEQLEEKGTYFSPFDHSELKYILLNFPNRNDKEKIYEDYEVRMKNAANKFILIFK